MFSNQDLKKLLLPLMIEQFLAVLVGMLDIVMVSSVGETAVSGVSLVDTINILLIQVFAALATGGAVVASQYLGRHDHQNARAAANQLILSMSVIAALITFIALLFRMPILHLAFGSVEPDIMKNAAVYFLITALSYPFLAIYNAGAALFRSMGNSKISMQASMAMNIINIAGNALGVYVLHLGVAGVALPTLASRIFGAIMMLRLLKNKQNSIYISSYLHLGFNPKMISHIMSIGIPNGLENGMFQFGKLLVASLVSTYGTVSIAANAVASPISTLQITASSAVGLAMVTIVGQCVGANKIDEAVYYTKKLVKWSYAVMALFCLSINLMSPLIVKLYNLTPETASLAIKIFVYHGTMAIFIWPLSFTLPNALRAANDAKFAMIVSILSMWICRIALSYVFGSILGMGVFGVWVAMTVDWVFRSVAYVLRFRGGKWKTAERF